MADLAQRLWCEDEAQALTEYALALILISLVIITSAKKVSTEVREAYTATARRVANPRASGHKNYRHTDRPALWPGTWQSSLGGPSQAGNGPAENSSASSSSKFPR